MAHKRLIICAVLVATCYLIGATWAESIATPIQNNTSQNAGIASISKDNVNKEGAVPLTPTISSTATATASKTPDSVNKVTTSALPTLKPIANNTSNSTAAPDCICDGALLPRLDENGKELEICAKCKCNRVARNTTLIKVVVIIVIWIISILVIYMLFLMCLDPLLNKRVKANYQEHTNEDDDATSSNTPPLQNLGNQELNSRANVLNRVGHQQDKWKRQVREQRRHIYDRHTMLN